METIKYNKLVRDRIPDIIEESGKACVTEILSDEEYLRIEQLEKARAKKAEKRGAFQKKILLVEVKED